MIDQIDFHDGYADGLHVSGRTARIFLRTVADEKFTLTLNEIDALLVSNFKQGNIILDANILKIDDLDDAFVFNTCDYSDQLKTGFVLSAWAATAKEKGLSAIEITPTYGCSIRALFKSYALATGTALA